MLSLWYFVVEIWSPSEWLTHVTSSCWKAVIQCFQRFGTMLLLDTSFLLNIIYSVLLSMIRAYCCCIALELWGFFWAKQTLVIRPGTDVDIVMDYYYFWIYFWMTAPNRSKHAPNSAGNTFMHTACVLFFSPVLVYFLRMALSSSLPFETHIRGHIARSPLPAPLPCLPSSF